MTVDNSETIYYPVFLNIKGRKCLVVGGGQVAFRKVAILLESDAHVKVVSPELCPELGNLADEGKIEYVPRAYRKNDLKGVFIAIAATDSSIINRQVATEAREKAVLVNTVDDTDYCDFIAPSIIRRGEITIAISTSGASPALARKLRTRLEEEFGEEYGKLARLIGEVRVEVRKRNMTVDAEGWQAALDLDRLLGLIKKGEEAAAKTTLLNNLRSKQQKKA